MPIWLAWIIVVVAALCALFVVVRLCIEEPVIGAVILVVAAMVLIVVAVETLERAYARTAPASQHRELPPFPHRWPQAAGRDAGAVCADVLLSRACSIPEEVGHEAVVVPGRVGTIAKAQRNALPGGRAGCPGTSSTPGWVAGSTKGADAGLRDVTGTCEGGVAGQHPGFLTRQVPVRLRALAPTVVRDQRAAEGAADTEPSRRALSALHTSRALRHVPARCSLTEVSC